MCVKLPPKDLNSNPCPPHPTKTYTCRVTIAPRVHEVFFIFLIVHVIKFVATTTTTTTTIIIIII